jgi:putative flippase GtrA
VTQDVICELVMAEISRSDSVTAAVVETSPKATLGRKAISFALIGLINTGVDYGFFLLARAAFAHLPAALALFAALATVCRCAEADTVLLVAANVTSWLVAVSGSYVLNSWITFAAESGRRLHWRGYAVFVVSGIAGLVANTATLLIAAQVVLLPVWLAKGLAVLASFVVNFTLSHFVVFRVQSEPERDGGNGA